MGWQDCGKYFSDHAYYELGEDGRKEVEEDFFSLGQIAQKLLFLTHSMEAVEMFIWSGEYDARMGKRMQTLYEILSQFGFSLEDEEQKKILDGTSELYLTGEAEADLTGESDEPEVQAEEPEAQAEQEADEPETVPESEKDAWMTIPKNKEESAESVVPVETAEEPVDSDEPEKAVITPLDGYQENNPELAELVSGGPESGISPEMSSELLDILAMGMAEKLMKEPMEEAA